MIKLTQEELRAKLNDELKAVKASYICTVTGINKDVLSGFKRNKMNLGKKSFAKLSAYFESKN